MIIKPHLLLGQAIFTIFISYIMMASVVITLYSCESYSPKVILNEQDADEGLSITMNSTLDQALILDQTFRSYDYTIDQNLRDDMDMQNDAMNLMCESGQIQGGLHFEKHAALMQTRHAQNIHGFRRLYRADSSEFRLNKGLKYFIDSWAHHSPLNQSISSVLLTLPLKQTIETHPHVTWIEILGQGMGIAHLDLEHLGHIQLQGIDLYSGVDKFDPYIWNVCFKEHWQDFLATESTTESTTESPTPPSFDQHLPLSTHLFAQWSRFIKYLSSDQKKQRCTARLMIWGHSAHDIKQQRQSTIFKELEHTSLSRAHSDLLQIDTREQSYQVTSNLKKGKHQATWRWISPPQDLSIEQWLILSVQPRVLWIGTPAHLPQLTNENSRLLMGSNTVQQIQQTSSFNPSYLGYSGRRVRAAIMDNGIANHNDFIKYNEEGIAVGYRIDGALPPEGERHGTIVAGILGGSGHGVTTIENEYFIPRFLLRGQAPEVNMMTSHLMWGVRGASPEPAYVQAFVRNHAHVINHSHTQGGGYYYPENQAYDNFIAHGVTQEELNELEATPMHHVSARPVFYAAGNQGSRPSDGFSRLHGYYGLMVNLKNAMTIGSVHSNDGIHTRSSSYGPSLDGRIKPDLVAPGTSDLFPPKGLSVDIAEIRLHAKDIVQDQDYVWHFPQDEFDQWKGSGSLQKDETYVVDHILKAHIRKAYGSRLFWHDQPEVDEENPVSVPSIEASLYHSISFKIRFAALPSAIEFDQAQDRPALHTKHRYPHYWRLQWGGIDNNRYQHTRYFPYQEVNANEWITLHYDFDENWQGMIGRIRLSPFRYTNGIYSPSSDGLYGLSSGTSMASPAAAGVASLALQQLDTVLDYDLDNSPASPALIRGLMMHTARDLSLPAPLNRDAHVELDQASTYSIGPDWSTGYGLVDAWALNRLITLHTQEKRWHEDTIEAGEIHRYTIDVKQAGALKVSLVWDDPAGSVVTPSWEKKLVHDLDLAVRSPQGQIYTPWILSPPPLNELNYQDGVEQLEQYDLKPAYRCVLATIDELWEESTEIEIPPVNLDLGINEDMHTDMNTDMYTDMNTDMYTDMNTDMNTDMYTDMQPPSEDLVRWAPRLNQNCLEELNNYERVEIDLPSNGSYEILIRAHHEGTDAQKYHLIFSQDCSLSSDIKNHEFKMGL